MYLPCYYPNAIANAVGSSVVNPALDKYVLTSVNATCFIVPLSFVTTLSASANVVEEADVLPSMMFSSVAVEVTPSNMFNSAAVDVIEVPAICNVVAFTSPLEPYMTALLFTIVPADEPSTKFNSAPVDVTDVLLILRASVSSVPSTSTSPDISNSVAVNLAVCKSSKLEPNFNSN